MDSVDSLNTNLLNEKQKQLLSESDHDVPKETSESNESSKCYEHKSMQFPEDDVLTAGDLQELMEHVVEKPSVIIIKNQFSPVTESTPKPKKLNKVGKYTKQKPKEELSDTKNIVINLNLKQFASNDS